MAEEKETPIPGPGQSAPEGTFGEAVKPKEADAESKESKTTQSKPTKG